MTFSSRVLKVVVVLCDYQKYRTKELSDKFLHSFSSHHVSATTEIISIQARAFDDSDDDDDVEFDDDEIKRVTTTGPSRGGGGRARAQVKYNFGDDSDDSDM